MVAWRAHCMVGLIVAIGLAGCLGGGDDANGEPGAPDSQGPTEGAERRLDVELGAIRCPPGYDNRQADDICLAYNGQIPGPTWVFEAGERVNIILHHRVAETLDALGPDAEGAEHLAMARYSLHRHGVSLDACSDGVAQPVGTEVCDSTVGPGESITYTFDAVFPGFWHYHDHSTTFSVGAERGPGLGGEAVERGLWGSFLVLPPGETTERVFDLHLTDAGANGGLGLDGQARAGERFDLNVVGLGYLHRFYRVRLDDPDGDTVGEVLVGPGVSRGITVSDARRGNYTWTAEGLATSSPHEVLPSTPRTLTGRITVTEGGPADPAASSGLAGNERAPVAPAVPDRVFVIPFNHLDATARAKASGSMGLPLLEAKVGEVLEFRVVNADPVPHVFHLHGHPWVDPDTGAVIDAVPLVPGQQESHTFTVVAGLEAGHAGDWFYHCHIGYDAANAAMWGVLRVHP